MKKNKDLSIMSLLLKDYQQEKNCPPKIAEGFMASPHSFRSFITGIL
jgi:hypothetical protein